MFERYTEKARRVIFFARYEASQFGSPYIETEHLLLGLLRLRRLASRTSAPGDELERGVSLVGIVDGHGPGAYQLDAGW